MSVVKSKNGPSSRWARSGVLLLALFFAATTYGMQNLAQKIRAKFPKEDDLLHLPRPGALKIMSLGHHELASDLVFLRSMIYFGSQLHGDHNYRWLDHYLDTIVALDPLFKTPYRWAGVVTMYNGKEITNPGVLLSNHFLEKGIEQFPRDWELAFMLGCNYLFELKTKDAKQADEWQKKGITFIERAALLGGGPPWLPVLAATLYKKEGNDEAAIRHLEEVYLSTNNPKTKQEVQAKLLSMRARIDFAKADAEQAELTMKKMQTLRYAPDDFFILVNVDIRDRMDLESLRPTAPVAGPPPDESSELPDTE